MGSEILDSGPEPAKYQWIEPEKNLKCVFFFDLVFLPGSVGARFQVRACCRSLAALWPVHF
jgi:hypothetical protein